MDDFLEALLLLVVHWRAGLLLLLALIAAIFLCSAITWFTALYGFFLTLAGLIFGICWEARWQWKGSGK